MNNLAKIVQKNSNNLKQQLGGISKNSFCSQKQNQEVKNEKVQEQQDEKFTSQLKHTHEITDDFYETYRSEIFQQLYSKNGPQDSVQKISGFATSEGTLKYSQRKQETVDQQHFKTTFKDNLKLSSMGIGTYVGAPEKKEDLKMFNAIVDSVISGGVNVIDTAINYRYMKSERTVGAAIRHLVNNLDYTRDELFISSKGGYIIDDADNGISGQMLIKKLTEELKIVPKEEIITDLHSMHPAFLEYMINNSLSNLGLESLDLYYLHNSAEQQMSLLGEEKFYEKLKYSFEYLQKQVDETQLIKSYGMATWLCFRSPKEEEKIHTNLSKIVKIAQEIAGKDNGFKYIQTPLNLMMPEAFAEKWQESITDPQDEHYEKEVFLLRAARENQINIFTSSPLMQGSLLQVPLPTDVFKCKNLGAKHIQFVRSIPSPAIISTLVGQKTNRHTKMNLEVIQYPPLNIDEFWDFMTPKERQILPEEAIEID